MFRRNGRFLVFCAAILVAFQVYLVAENRVKVVNLEATTTERTLIFNSSACQCSRRAYLGHFGDQKGANWCSFESSLRGRHQNVISYSIFGDAVVKKRPSKYFDSLQTIADQARKLYPDWQLRIYHNFRSKQSVEHKTLCHIYCTNENVDLCDVSELISDLSQLRKKSLRTPITPVQLNRLNRLLWRFLPLLDPTVDLFMVRDTDAEIIEREASAVDEWLRSNYTFHVMRDHQLHDAPILSGMFGAKVTQKRDMISSLVKVMITLGQYPGRSEDQDLLEKIFWPTVKDDAVIHDSYSCDFPWNALTSRPFPTRRVNFTFVSDRRGADWVKPETCPVACRPPDHLDWQYC